MAMNSLQTLMTNSRRVYREIERESRHKRRRTKALGLDPMILKRRKYVHETQFTNCGLQEKGWYFQRRKGEHSGEGKVDQIKKEIPVVRIATMNIRGSSENKLEILTETMENSHIDITIVKETRNKWRTTRNFRGYNILDTQEGQFGVVAIIYITEDTTILRRSLLYPKT